MVTVVTALIWGAAVFRSEERAAHSLVSQDFEYMASPELSQCVSPSGWNQVSRDILNPKQVHNGPRDLSGSQTW